MCNTCLFPQKRRLQILILSLNTEAKRKQREFSEDADEDAAFVAANSVKKPCAREGLRGIFNLGQTCYMSVILQALLHNSILTTYFLGNGHKAFDCTEDHCINCALSDAFAEFNNDEKADGIVSLSLLYYSWLSSPEVSISSIICPFSSSSRTPCYSNKAFFYYKSWLAVNSKMHMNFINFSLISFTVPPSAILKARRIARTSAVVSFTRPSSVSSGVR